MQERLGSATATASAAAAAAAVAAAATATATAAGNQAAAPAPGKAETLCRVCGDKASGKHYGVASCDGCRGFFKRSIRRNLDYVCKEEGRCVVDVSRRNQCQACRFSKCLQVNMKKDAVQHERAPRAVPASVLHSPFATASVAGAPFGGMPHRSAAGCITGGVGPMGPFHGSPLDVPAAAAVLLYPPHAHYTSKSAAFFSHAHLGVPLPMSLQSTPPSLLPPPPHLPSPLAFPTFPQQSQPLLPPPPAPPPAPAPAPAPAPPPDNKEDEVTSSEEARLDLAMSPPSDCIDDQESQSFFVAVPRLSRITIISEQSSPPSPSPAATGERGRSTDPPLGSSPLHKSPPEPSPSNTPSLANPLLPPPTPTPTPTLPPLPQPSFSLLPVENIYESAAKLLFLAVKWARSIPSFLQLSSSDQTILLEEAWSELFVLSAAQWQLPVDEEVLVSSSVSPTARRASLAMDARRLRDIVSRFAALCVDHTEFACLKALVLFKAETPGLSPSAAMLVEALQDQTHVMLSDYCGAARRRARFGRLLLLLPAVRALPARPLQELFFRHTVGEVAIERLLRDMLAGQPPPPPHPLSLSEAYAP